MEWPIGRDDQVGFEPVGVLAHEFGDMRTADLFLALKQEDHVAGQLAIDRKVRFERQQLREVLTLVVTNAPRIDAAVANGRFEGGTLPKFERVRRLHIVVAIKQDRRLVRRHVAPAKYHRMVPCRQNFRLHAEVPQHFHKHGCDFNDADIMRAYAGVTRIVHHARDKCLVVGIYMIKQLLQLGIDDAHLAPPAMWPGS